jgi:hypothetical protein
VSIGGTAATSGGVGRAFTGSWAYQILPFIDQVPLYNSVSTAVGLAVYMDPGRGRPTLSSTGPWTDYMINTYLNDNIGGQLLYQDNKRTMVGITDGSSNTICVGQGIMPTSSYGSNVAGVWSDLIYNYGTTGLGRSLQTNSKDLTTTASYAWGGPYSAGSLMSLCDGTVRMFPYSTYSGTSISATGVGTGAFAVFLTPTGGETGILP